MNDIAHADISTQYLYPLWEEAAKRFSIRQEYESWSRLTPTQQEVFKALGQGKSLSEIAYELQMAEWTLKTHLGRIYKAFEVDEFASGKGVRVALIAKRAEQIVHPPLQPTRPFTPRETQILERIPEGKTDQEIASDLGINVGTVKTHLRTIGRITGERKRIKLALRYGG